MKKLFFIALIGCCFSCNPYEPVDFPFEVFPNPVINEVSLSTNNDAEILLLDVDGEVLSDTLIDAGTMITWDVEDARDGVLHLEVTINETIYRKPIYKITE